MTRLSLLGVRCAGCDTFSFAHVFYQQFLCVDYKKKKKPVVHVVRDDLAKN